MLLEATAEELRADARALGRSYSKHLEAHLAGIQSTCEIYLCKQIIEIKKRM